MPRRIPRLYAAASLKLRAVASLGGAHLLYSAALCRGLIEAATCRSTRRLRGRRIPRLYAAASLKRSVASGLGTAANGYSAALCRGLIEATPRRS